MNIADLIKQNKWSSKICFLLLLALMFVYQVCSLGLMAQMSSHSHQASTMSQSMEHTQDTIASGHHLASCDMACMLLLPMEFIKNVDHSKPLNVMYFFIFWINLVFEIVSPPS